MDVLHLDCETHPVTQDDPAPPPICLQYCVSPEPEIRTGVASPFLPHGEGGLEYDAPIGSASGEGFLVDAESPTSICSSATPRSSPRTTASRSPSDQQSRGCG